MNKVCQQCNKGYRTSHKETMHCSNKCRGIARTLKGTAEKECKECGDKFRIRVSMIKHREKIGKKVGVFCSKKCRQKASIGRKLTAEHKAKLVIAHTGVKLSPEHLKARTLGQMGENNRFWKGGITKVPGYFSFRQKRREIMKKGNGGTHTQGEWETLKKQYGFTCPACHLSEPEIKLTEDHVIPISKGGCDAIENIQPLCRVCNSKKAIKCFRYELVEVNQNQ